MKNIFFATRCEPQHLEKIDRIAQATGLNRSQVFRQLVERATFEPTRITVNLAANNNSSAVSSQAGSAAVVSVQ